VTDSESRRAPILCPARSVIVDDNVSTDYAGLPSPTARTTMLYAALVTVTSTTRPLAQRDPHLAARHGAAASHRTKTSQSPMNLTLGVQVNSPVRVSSEIRSAARGESPTRT
jgi:hypothetical protein